MMKMRLTNLLLLIHACAASTFTGSTRSRSLLKKKATRSNRKDRSSAHKEVIHEEEYVTENTNPAVEQKHNLVLDLKGGAEDAARKLTSLDLALAGAVATMIGDASMHPIDCIKTLQQSNEGAGLNMLAATKQIWNGGGLGAFYTGLGTYVISDGLAGSLKFATYEALKHWVDDNVKEEQKGGALFLVAGVAFIVSSVVLVPGELIKQRLQMGQISSVAEGFSTIWKNEGILGFFTGYSGVCLRDVPYTMMELGIYDNLKSMYINWKSERSSDGEDYQITQWDEVIAAAITGGIIGYLTAPLDNIKTKLMVDVGYSGFFDCVSKTVSANGLGALFNGGGARVAWLMPFTAIYLPVYEVFKRRLAASKSSDSPLKVKGGAQMTPVKQVMNERLVNTCSAARVGLQRGVHIIDNARCMRYY